MSKSIPTDPYRDLRLSKKFQSWGKLRPEDLNPKVGVATEEKHFTPEELAKIWGVSAQTVRTLFEKEKDVLRLTRSDGSKRKYILLRIPESVVNRVHRRLSAVPA